MGKNQWVSPKGKQWSVKGEGNKKATKLVDTQAEAVKIAKAIAKNQESEVIVQGKKGQIRSKDSYGNDPNPPRDTEH